MVDQEYPLGPRSMAERAPTRSSEIVLAQAKQLEDAGFSYTPGPHNDITLCNDPTLEVVDSRGPTGVGIVCMSVPESKKNARIGCVMVSFGAFYNALGECAKNSFKIFNPEVELFYITEKTIEQYPYLHKYIPFRAEADPVACSLKGFHPGRGDNHRAPQIMGSVPDQGVLKYRIALDIMREEKLDKLIVLGADTITCARLDEFLAAWHCDIVVTHDYSAPLEADRYSKMKEGTFGVTKLLLQPPRQQVNADVVCFNNIKALEDIVEIGPHHITHAEQGALNEIVYGVDYSYNVADAESTGGGPFSNAKAGAWIKKNVCYNVGSKSTLYEDRRDEHGNRYLTTTVVVAESSIKPWKGITEKFSVEDEKLFTGDGRQIKVWHFCEGFGAQGEEQALKIMNDWIFELFNEDTKKFFKEHCGCGDFFEKEFTLRGDASL